MQNKPLTLAQFVIEKRSKLGLNQTQLAEHSGIDFEQIVAIEQGIDLFLPSTIRQKLAHALKVENKVIKSLEKKMDLKLVKDSKMEEIREQILLNANNPNLEIKCPLCGEKLITRIAKLYDLEDNLVLRPKARCSKCPFQLTD